jgi:hypothetical protein
MKKSSWLFIIFMILVTQIQLSGQEKSDWPKSTSSILANIGTMGIATPISLQCENLWHGNKGHLGLSTGMIHTFYYDETLSGILGFYLAMVLMTGVKEHHFEGRIGISYHPIYTFPEGGTKNEEVPFMPVVTLGYRFQKPDGNRFYRVSLGSGGIGFGIGFVLGQKK